MPKFLILNKNEIKNVCEAYMLLLSAFLNEANRAPDALRTSLAELVRFEFEIAFEVLNPFELANDLVYEAYTRRDLKTLMYYYNELSKRAYFNEVNIYEK